MQMRIKQYGVVASLALCGMVMLGADEKPAAADADGSGAAFSKEFFEEKSDLLASGKNPFFNLTPGTVMEYEGKEDGEATTLKISVLDETKQVDGVECRVVEERESSEGKLKEVSRNYFAISKRTNNVYYFGEDSREYKDEKEVSNSGSWEAGKDGARYGLMLPACPLLGARYYQEIAPGKAMDRAENVSVTESMKVPAGNYDQVLKTEETTPLEKGHEFKYYAPGVGLIKDGDLVLVRTKTGKKSD
jgi:hypothetical protein